MLIIKSFLGAFEQIPFINYIISFWTDLKGPMSDLIDFGSKINVIHPVYAKKLGLTIQKTNIDTQKIDNTALKAFRMIIAVFSMNDKAKKIGLFEKIFLLTNISMDIALGMFFLTLSNTNI